MKIHFKLATEPAVKGIIAVVACILIAYVSIHNANTYGVFQPIFSLVSLESSSTHTKHFPFALPHKIKEIKTSIMSNTVSAASIKAQMPHPTLIQVLGEPTHKQVKMIIRELTTNLMAVSCPWDHNMGHLGLLQNPTIYLAQNTEAFKIPESEPPTYPAMPNGTTALKREELRATNLVTCKAWATYKLVLTIMSDQFAVAINNIYYAVLANPMEGLNSVNLCTLVQHILTTHAQISQPDLDDNMSNFNTGINPGLPLSIYTRKQEKCQVFAASTGVLPISDKRMVTTGSKHALACSNMTLGWREWKRRPEIEHTWAN
jgi:hypothetical protein